MAVRLRRRRSSLLLVALGCAHGSSAQAPENCQVETPSQPLLVLSEFSEWVGSPAASFVLYADGTVVYAERDKQRWPTKNFRQTRLTPAAVEMLMSSLPLDPLSKVEWFSSVGFRSDQNIAVITWWSATQRQQASVYGPVSREAREDVNASPAAFVDVYERLRAFTAETGEPYRYSVIEVEVQPLPPSGSQMPSVAWPPGWPTLKSPGSVKHEWNYYGDIYMTASCEPAVLEFARSLGTRRTFQLDATEYLLLTVHEALPSEKSWQRSHPQ